MDRWSNEAANAWYEELPFLIGCNFLPSTASNQLEMFQSETFDEPALKREVGWARELGFNTLRVYLHDLLVEEEGFFGRLEKFLDICRENDITLIIVLFDDCHYGYPKRGPQKPPIRGIHNSRWKQARATILFAKFTKGPAKRIGQIEELCFLDIGAISG